MRKKRVMKSSRNRTKMRIRRKVVGADSCPRISIFKSSKCTYAQIISDDSQKTLVSGSTVQEDVKKAMGRVSAEGTNGTKSTKGVIAAKALGLVIAEKAKALNVSKVVFDRNGYTFTGRVKALADGAREGGLEF